VARTKRRRKQIKKPQSKKHGRCRKKTVLVRGHSRSPRSANGGKPRPTVRRYRRSRPC